MKITCVIPAFNEGGKIAHTLGSLSDKVDEIIVVDDGSTDNTLAEASAFPVILLKHAVNRGQGASLMTGTQYARERGADIVVHFDADGQFSPNEIGRVIKPLLEGRADVVFGSRFLDKNSRLPHFKRAVIIPLAHLANKILIGRTLSDPQSGFRAFNRKIAGRLEIENDGAAHCTEIIHKAFALGGRVVEVPITVKYSEYGQGLWRGKGRGTGGIKALADLLIYKLLS